jgi:hypothetical protein
MTQALDPDRVRDLPVRRIPVLVTASSIGVQGTVKVTGTLRRRW